MDGAYGVYARRTHRRIPVVVLERVGSGGQLADTGS